MVSRRVHPYMLSCLSRLKWMLHAWLEMHYVNCLNVFMVSNGFFLCYGYIVLKVLLFGILHDMYVSCLIWSITWHISCNMKRCLNWLCDLSYWHMVQHVALHCFMCSLSNEWHVVRTPCSKMLTCLIFMSLMSNMFFCLQLCILLHSKSS